MPHAGHRLRRQPGAPRPSRPATPSHVRARLFTAEHALDQHGDEDALDDDAHHRLDGGHPGLGAVLAELLQEHATTDGAEAVRLTTTASRSAASVRLPPVLGNPSTT